MNPITRRRKDCSLVVAPEWADVVLHLRHPAQAGCPVAQE